MDAWFNNMETNIDVEQQGSDLVSLRDKLEWAQITDQEWRTLVGRLKNTNNPKVLVNRLKGFLSRRNVELSQDEFNIICSYCNNKGRKELIRIIEGFADEIMGKQE